MLPIFLVEESTVRESGQSSVFDGGEHSNKDLVLTLGITHAIERESIEIDIYGSRDGVHWPAVPVVRFAPKFYCGSYQLSIPPGDARYFKAAWRVQRWSRNGEKPFFRFYLFVQPAVARVAVAGAA